MIELLLASVIVGKTEISPNVIQIDFMTANQEIVTILDTIEIPEDKD